MFFNWRKWLDQVFRFLGMRRNPIQRQRRAGLRLELLLLEARLAPAIIFPANGGSYTSAGWNAGNSTPAGDIAGTADAPSGVQKEEVSIRQGTGMYWGGTSFNSVSEFFVTATGTTSWTTPFDAANFPADGSYTVHARTTDNQGNVDSSPTATFIIDNAAATSTIRFPASGGLYNATSWNAGAPIAGTTFDNGPTTVNEFTVPTAFSGPSSITAGPDGNLWYTEGANQIGQINPTTHAFQEFPIPTADGRPEDITAGPDGNLWFVENRANKVALINPTTHAFQEFAIPTADGQPNGITAGPDGNLWFTESNADQIGQINPTTHAFQEFPVPTANSGPDAITAGPDGNLWFTEYDSSKIGQINPTTHVFQEFDIPNGSNTGGIVAGPDGNLWFTEPNADNIGQINPTTHAFQEFDIPRASSSGAIPTGITAGPDGNLWFVEDLRNKIGQINPTTHAFQEFDIPTTDSEPQDITAGPDGNLWFTEGGAEANKIGQALLGSGLQKEEVSILQVGTGKYWNGASFSSNSESFVSASGTASWSAAFPASNFQADGSYTVHARATDNAGNVESGPTATFTYDHTAPTSTISFPTAAASYNASSWNAGALIAGTASDTGGAGLQKEEVSIRQGSGLYWGGASFNSVSEFFVTATGTSSWSTAFPASNFPADGSYTVHARATDNAGNVESGPTATFIIDNAAPTSTIRFPASGGLYNAASWNAGAPIAGMAFDNGPTTINEFTVPTSDDAPSFITAGADGNLWFVENRANKVALINPTTHAFQEFTIPSAASDVEGITAGPDGNLWFVEDAGNKVGQINPTTHAFQEFTIPTANSGFDSVITTGSDGNLWFTEFNANQIGQINPTTHVFQEFTIPTADADTRGITAGPDGNLWFTEANNNKIGQINPTTHAFQEFVIPTANSFPTAITAGADSNLWFVELNPNQLGQINPTTHAFQEFAIPGPNSNVKSITAGPDGNLWFTEQSTNQIGQFNPTTHAFQEFTVPTAASGLVGITAGPDGNLWFTEALPSANKIGQVQLGSGLQKEEVSILQVGTGKYWNGASFSSNSESFVSASGTASWSAAFPANNFPADGSYTVHARATDNASNVESGPTATFTYDNTAPTSTIRFPIAAATYNATSWNTAAPIAGTASDTGGAGLQKEQVSIRQGSGLYWGGTSFNSVSEFFVTASGTSTWSTAFPASNFPADGSYTVHARATDNAGNVESGPTATFTVAISVVMDTQPASATIDNGQSDTLSVSASGGTAPYSYQWYIGASGTTTNPIGGATSSSVNVAPSSTTSYWVRVTDSAATPISADSNAAVITVNAALTIGTPPASASIDNGQSDTLSFAASNGTTPYSYQWYIGTSGTTTNPISGATNSTYAASPSSTTSYWVRVTDSANGTAGPTHADSNTAVITVNTALTIGTQPTSATIDNGQSDTLSVAGSGGTTPHTYQWYIGASGTTTTPIGGATNSTYAASPPSTTSYWVRVTDSANGSAGPTHADSNAAVITVNSALTIGTQPTSATIDNGQSDTLSVAGSGGTTPHTYQWYIGASGTTTTPIGGATNSTYAPSPSSTTSYWVRVTDSANGSAGPTHADSNAAVITVNSALTIGTQPTSATIDNGQSDTLSVAGSGGTTPHTYQWYIGTTGTTTNPIGGATSSSVNVAPSSTTSYWLRVTDSANGTAGPTHADSNTAVITVNTALTIGTQPISATIDNGQSDTLRVAGSGGTTPHTYQWYIGASGTTTTPIGGATNSTYAPSPSSTTSYWVRVTDSANGTAGATHADSNTAVITVNSALGIGTQPVSATIDNGQSDTLSVAGSGGTTPHTYQWYIGTTGTTTNPIGGATSSSLNVAPSSTTSYWVHVTDSANGSAGPAHADSNTAVITVNTALTIGTQPASATIDNGQSDTLRVTGSGGTTPHTYQWYIGTSGTTTNPIGGATSSSVNVAPSSTTSYWVRVTDSANGTAGATHADSNTAVITVNSALGIGTQPVSATIDNGQSDTLSVAGSGGTTPHTYQWYIGTTGITTNPINGATGSSFSASPTSTTSYWARVTDSANGTAGATHADSNTAVITVNTALTIGTQPASATIDNGQSDTLSVAGSGGTTPHTYQWYIGTTGTTTNPINGATSSSLVVTPGSTRSYWVRVTDSANGTAGAAQADSNTAVITVNAALTIGTQPANSAIDNGQSKTLTVAGSGGTTPHLYQWYVGTSGNTANPINGATSSSLVVTPASTTSYWVRVTDSANGTAGATHADSNTAVVTVNAPPSLSTPSTTVWTQDKAITAGQMTLTISNGTPPHQVTAFTLPAGLSATVSGNTVNITGTPTSAVVNFAASVTVTDSVGVQALKNFSMTINPAQTFTPAALPAYTVGQAYSQTITTAGGTGARVVTYTLSGPLPAGMTMTPSGTSNSITISGTPTNATSVTITMTVTDSVGAVTVKVYTLNVYTLAAVPDPRRRGATNFALQRLSVILAVWGQAHDEVLRILGVRSTSSRGLQMTEGDPQIETRSRRVARDGSWVSVG